MSYTLAPPSTHLCIIMQASCQVFMVHGILRLGLRMLDVFVRVRVGFSVATSPYMYALFKKLLTHQSTCHCFHRYSNGTGYSLIHSELYASPFSLTYYNAIGVVYIHTICLTTHTLHKREQQTILHFTLYTAHSTP